MFHPIIYAWSKLTYRLYVPQLCTFLVQLPTFTIIKKLRFKSPGFYVLELLASSSGMLFCSQMLPQNTTRKSPSHWLSPSFHTSPFLICIHVSFSSSIGAPTHTLWMCGRLAELRWKTASHLKSSGVVSHETVLRSAQCSVTMAWLYSRALIWHQTGQLLLT